MSRVAVIGGDERVLRADWPADVRAYRGDDARKLADAARSGSIRGVVALSKFLDGGVRSNLKALPPGVKVVYWPNSINSLTEEIEAIIDDNFPEAPPLRATTVAAAWPRPIKAPQPNTPLAPPPPKEAPVLPQPTPQPALKGVAAEHEPWTPDEDAALQLACEQHPGATWNEKQSIFVSLGGRARSATALQQRHRKLRLAAAEAPQQQVIILPRNAPPETAPVVARLLNEEPPAPEVTAAFDAERHYRHLVRLLKHIREGVELGLINRDAAYDQVMVALAKEETR